MTKKPSYFIYERREVTILIVLALVVTVFSFTLGVHLGKRVGPKGMAGELPDAVPAQTQDEAAPERVNLAEQSEGLDAAVNESLDTELQEEVQHSGIELKVKKQVDLPAQPKSPNAGATTLSPPSPAQAPTVPAHTTPTHAGSPASEPLRYTIQVGSFVTQAEAERELKGLQAKGIEKSHVPYIRQMSVKGKGDWYRLYLGGFASKKDAEDVADSYVKKQVFQKFIVARTPGVLTKTSGKSSDEQAEP